MFNWLSNLGGKNESIIESAKKIRNFRENYNRKGHN